MQHAMKASKFLHVRVPHDFHQQLVKYAEDRFIPVSSVVLQAVANVIEYKPKPAAPRGTYTPTTPQYWDGTKYVSSPKAQAEEETYTELTEADFDLEDLQRRAAAAPVKPV